MQIIAFTTKETNWKVPRMGLILNDGHRDSGYRLDCERLFESVDRPMNSLSWFDMDGPWFQRSRETYETLVRDASTLAEAREKGWLIRSEDAYWFAPVPRPGKLICIGLNYRDHAAESNMAIPERPVVFSKFSTAVIAPGEPVVLPATSAQVDYEAELAVVIGRSAKNVSASRALDYVLGYTVFNDVSARDFQFADGQWQRGKSCDSNTDQLIFGVPELIEFLSQTITLEPGDVIATGTPPGVGFARKPPVFLQPGDEMVVDIERVGKLNNPVVSAEEGIAKLAHSNV